MFHYSQRKALFLSAVVLIVFFAVLTYCTRDKELPCPEENPAMAARETCVRLKDTDYYWSSVITSMSAERFKLPEDYEYVGEIQEYCSKMPLTKNMQMYAPFTIRAFVYASEENEDRLYVRVSTDWIEDNYVVFVKKELRQ